METLKERPPVEGEDFYREGAYVVLTAAYLLRRGYCCGSGCRHCPYGEELGSHEKKHVEEGREE